MPALGSRVAETLFGSATSGSGTKAATSWRVLLENAATTDRRFTTGPTEV